MTKIALALAFAAATATFGSYSAALAQDNSAKPTMEQEQNDCADRSTESCPTQADANGKMHLEDVSIGIISDKATPKYIA